MERQGKITFKGGPVTLVGPELKPGEAAPDFTVVDRGLREVKLKDFEGKAKLISVAVSLDTSVCETQARRFNEEASHLPPEIAVMNITMDLPFAIGRFCATEGIEKIGVFSDYRYASFGTHYGVLVKELRLLARSVFLLDSKDRIVYREIVKEATHPVDYEKALSHAKKLLAGR